MLPILVTLSGISTLCKDVHTKNVFSQKAEFCENMSINISKPVPAKNIIEDALENIIQAKRPLIISGGGVIQADASQEITKFARILNIPVVSTMMGLGTYPSDDENYLGMIGIFGHPGANRAVKEADLIFAVGTRFNDRIRCCFEKNELGKKLVQVEQILQIIAASQQQEETPHFLLEHNQQGNHTHTHELPQDGGNQPHVERLHQQPRQINRENSRQDIHRRRPLHQTVQLVKDERYYQNI